MFSKASIKCTPSYWANEWIDFDKIRFVELGWVVNFKIIMWKLSLDLVNLRTYLQYYQNSRAEL